MHTHHLEKRKVKNWDKWGRGERRVLKAKGLKEESERADNQILSTEKKVHMIYIPATLMAATQACIINHLPYNSMSSVILEILYKKEGVGQAAPKRVQRGENLPLFLSFWVKTGTKI